MTPPAPMLCTTTARGSVYRCPCGAVFDAAADRDPEALQVWTAGHRWHTDGTCEVRVAGGAFRREL